MVPFSTKKAYKDIRISYSLKYKHSEKQFSLRKSIDQKSNNTMSVMLCMGATFVKKYSYIAARIVSFDTAGLYLLTLRSLGPYPSKDIELGLCHVISN